MSGLPEPAGLGAYVDGLIAQERPKRSDNWEKTPEGRASLEAQRLELQRLKPIDPRKP